MLRDQRLLRMELNEGMSYKKEAKRERVRSAPTTKKRAAADKMTASVGESLPNGLAQPALRALTAAGITSLDHFTRITEKELIALHGMGPKAMKTIRTTLKAKGKSFAA